MEHQEGKSGQDLAKALKDGTLQAHRTNLLGMVDQSKSKDHIRFTINNCDDWIEVPIDLIDSWELKGHRRCRDHDHPIVSLDLKAPTKSVEKMYFDLICQLSNSLSSIDKFQNGYTRPIPKLMARRRPGGSPGYDLNCHEDCAGKYFDCLNRGTPRWLCEASYQICDMVCDSYQFPTEEVRW
ncbi:MAG: hypothetical protein PVH63_10610 [Balneolaceae bacterium]|jgi:hypothetical protein